MLAIRLPENIEQRLDALSKLTGRTKTFFAREALLAHLDQLEKQYLPQPEALDTDVKEALLAWKTFQDAGEHIDWQTNAKPWLESWFEQDERSPPHLQCVAEPEK